MFFIDELKDMKLYKKKFLLPLNDKNKRKNSVSMLMGTDYVSSQNLMNDPIMIPRYYLSYYTERAVLYYINQENGELVQTDYDVVNESIESIMDSNTRRIYYNGYSNNIQCVSKYFNFNELDRLSADYKVKIKYPIMVDVVGHSQSRKNTANHIYILSQSMYDKSLKGYDMYIYFNMMELILNNANPNMPDNVKYAIALYESGLYDAHKHNWIFGNRLKALCRAVEVYVSKHGHKSMARDIVKDPGALGKDDIGSFIQSDIKTFFGMKENCEYPKIDDDWLLPLNESCLMGVINENSSVNTMLKKDLYADRFKSTKELKEHYKIIKEKNPQIKYTYNSIEMYKQLNLFVDLAYYNMSFIKNNTFSRIRGYNVYFELMTRLIMDKRFETNGYINKTVLIPIHDWDFNKDIKLWMINQTINPISCIYYNIVNNPAKLKEIFKDTTFVFMGSKGYFKVNFTTADMRTISQFFVRNMKLLRNAEYIPEDEEDTRESSPKAITVDLVDKVEKAQGLEIDDISTNTKKPEEKVSKTENEEKKNKEEDKKKLVQTISKAAETNGNSEDTIDTLDNNEELKTILANLSADADEKSNISDARASRMIKLQNDIMDKQFKNKPLRDLMTKDFDATELKSKEVKVDSVNEEWKDIKFQSQEEVYDMDADIVKMFNSFTDKSYPLAVRDIKVEDNSTSEDAVSLYTVSYENDAGKRFSIKLDIPKWIDNKYLILRGNKKDIPNQLFLMPIIKTDSDTVQIVSNYNKIFIRRFGTTSGKSLPICDKLIKTLSKNEFKNLKIEGGDNTKICNRYELPIDYIDMAGIYNKISTPNMTIYFNQDELRSKYKDKIDPKAGIPIGVQGNTILYYNSIVGKDNEFISFSNYLLLLLDTDNSLKNQDFYKKYEATPRSIRYTYSRASILSSNIPLVVICAYSEGLTKVMKRAGIKYRIEKDKKSMDMINEDFVKFNDAYLIYRLDYASSLLMNGIKVCNTEDFSIAEMDRKPMYLSFLDNFGGRIKADGLDNFYNLMIDKPITFDTLKYYKLPTDYIDVLLYANRLLADNKFVKHTQISNNRRIRRHEQIPAILYGVLARAYGKYCTDLKHGKYVPMSIKQGAVVDEILINSTTSDKSIINALSEFEAYAAVTPKGPCGMNSDRSYTLDKRSFDPSMLNVLGMSTGFAGNVGITRQTTIDANISTARGYIKDNDEVLHELSPTKSLCMTEALTPFGCTRDDPFRTAMTFIQTSKHGMRCKRSNPALITSGADEALPHLISNIFAYKAKEDGVITDINDDRMIIEYKDGSYDYVDLSEKIEKNSSSGFYVSLKLDTDLKVGKKIKKDDIVAYDKSSFSNDIGATDNIAYNIGTLAKFAILNTDEGFEDSSIISHDLSDAMTSDVILRDDRTFSKNTNIYNLVEKGQKIEEGDPLLIAQVSYDEDDVNTLMRNLTGDEDEITDLGRVPIKSHVTGVVQDIKIYRTVDIDELSPTLKKVVNKYEKDIKQKKKEMQSYNVEDADIVLGPTGKLPATGILKNADDGVRLMIYLKYEDKMSIGDKLIYYSADKGVVKDIFPVGKEPKSSYRPNEKVHSLLSAGSVNGRMVCSIMINGGIYKGLIELARHAKDILGIKYKDNLFE